MRHGRLGGALCVIGPLLLPAAAPAAAIAPLKPCYVSATKQMRESVVVAGTGFTPGAQLDIAVDGRVIGAATADEVGGFDPQAVRAPFVARGSRAFDVVVSERGDPQRAVRSTALVSALSVRIAPTPRPPAATVTWRGSGFTARRPVYAHYVRRGTHRRTIRLANPKGPCGTFRTRARQFPFEPAGGRWVVRIDQRRRYRARARGIFWSFEVTVRRAKAARQAEPLTPGPPPPPASA